MTRFAAGLLLAAQFITLPLLAQPNQSSQSNERAEIAELRAQLAILTARLDQLEQREARQTAVEQMPEAQASQAPSGSAASWPDRVRLSGDLRYRYETINDDASRGRNWRGQSDLW
jgi:type II secretory pathway component PulJ